MTNQPATAQAAITELQREHDQRTKDREAVLLAFAKALDQCESEYTGGQHAGLATKVKASLLNAMKEVWKTIYVSDREGTAEPGMGFGDYGFW